MDKNKDGIINKEEFKSYLGKMLKTKQIDKVK